MPDSAALWPQAVVAATAACLVVLVVLRGRRAPASWLAFTGTVLLLGAIIVTPFSLPLPWDGALNIAGYALVLTAYPDGRMPWRALWVPVGGYLALAAVFLLSPPELTATPWWNAALAGELLLVVVTVHRYRRRLSAPERESVRWAVLGALVTFTGMFALAGTAAARGVGTISALGPLGDVAASLFGAALPFALAIGLLRPRVLPADAALRHVVAVIGWTLPLLGLYAAVRAVFGPEWAASSTVVAAALWAPGARRVADFLVFDGRPSPGRAGRLLTERMAALATATDAPRVLAETAAETLRLARVEVGGPRLRPAATGDAPAREALPVRYQGDEIATLSVAPRRAETALTFTDRAVLSELIRRAAPALHGARAHSELLDARARELRAHEHGRQRLRRDLHDELAPTLVGVSLTADGIARMLDVERHPLTDVAAQLATDAHTALAQTRALAHGLRPPALGDHDLAEAVRETLRSSPALEVVVTTPDVLLALPVTVEVAALRILQEAVANVHRHAGARRCDVRIGIESGRLRLEVEDDGRGMLPGRPPGMGLRSMRERASELGGAFTVEPARGGGVRVTATIPIGMPT